MELYKLVRIRKWLVKYRAIYFIKILKKLKTISSNSSFDVTVSHNLKSLYQCNDRMNLLIKPLMVIEKINSKSKILVIGPRNENDLFLLSAEGISFKNITGVDLITYSPYIKAGDMHSLEFQNNCFDAILIGWTLSYSSEPQKVIDEIIRVAKNGALVGVGVEYSQLTKDDCLKLLGYSIQDFDKLPERINSTKAIIELFGNNQDHVYFNHDAPLRRSHQASGYIQNPSSIGVILQIKKG